MQAVTRVEGRAYPWGAKNIDTDVIIPAHWLKTWTAVRDEVDVGLPDSTRVALLAAVNRLLAARFKERHPLRTAHQALGFVKLRLRFPQIAQRHQARRNFRSAFAGITLLLLKS